jgi:archaellum component FlaC
MQSEDRLLQAIATLDQAISTLDRDLKHELTGVKQDIAGVKQDIAGTKQDITGMKLDVAGVKLDVAGLREEMYLGFASVNARIDGLDTQITEIHSRLDATNLRLSKLEIDVLHLSDRVSVLEVWRNGNNGHE